MNINVFMAFCLMILSPQNLIMGNTNVQHNQLMYLIEWVEASELSFDQVIDIEKMYIEAFRLGYRTCGSFSELSDEKINTDLIDYFTSTVKPRFSSLSSLCALVKHGEKVIGIAFFEKSAETEIYVAELAVHANYWKQGIGKSLMRAILEKEPKTKKIWLITEHINKGSQAFYESLGFMPSIVMHEGYSPDLYRGYEKQL